MIKTKEYNKFAKNLKDQVKSLRVERIFFNQMIQSLKLNLIKLALIDIYLNNKDKKLKNKD